MEHTYNGTANEDLSISGVEIYSTTQARYVPVEIIFNKENTGTQPDYEIFCGITKIGHLYFKEEDNKYSNNFKLKYLKGSMVDPTNEKNEFWVTIYPSLKYEMNGQGKGAKAVREPAFTRDGEPRMDGEVQATRAKTLKNEEGISLKQKGKYFCIVKAKEYKPEIETTF